MTHDKERKLYSSVLIMSKQLKTKENRMIQNYKMRKHKQETPEAMSPDFHSLEKIKTKN